MKHTIKRIDGSIIAESDDGTFIELVEKNKYELMGANLMGANLYRANLMGANLYRANLYRADLEGANLKGADLEGAIIYLCNRKVVLK